MMVDIVDLCVYLFGNIEFLICMFMVIKVGIGMDLVNFIWVLILFVVVMFFIVNFMIKKFNFVIVGCNGNYDVKNVDEVLLDEKKVVNVSE